MKVEILERVMDYKTIKNLIKLSNKRIKKLKQQGVVFLDSKSCIVGAYVKIAKGVVIYPNNIILGETIIYENCEILEGNEIIDSVIKSGSKISKSVIHNSKIGSNCSIGPFSHIRPNCEIKDNCKVGAFAEIKNSTLGFGSKLPHLSYVGDAYVGENVNIGCGVIFANYNGKIKQKTYVGDDCFIGCNSNLVAPLKIGNNCFIAAGSTVNKNLNNDQFTISRVKQVNKNNTFNNN